MATKLAQSSAIHDNALLADAFEGLFAARKTLPSKYFYDEEGSALFEAICDVPEYHVTRGELELMHEVVADIGQEIPAHSALVEFGSGASVKTRLLLESTPRWDFYVPIDISASAVFEAAAAIRNDYPHIVVAPIVGDFTTDLELPAALSGRPIFGYFPGSTIGNFAPAAAVSFLANAREQLGPGARFILGADMTRAPGRLIPAYDDAAGVTAAFNKNLLTRLNRECEAAFDLDAFEHRAVWNEKEGRVEMHLVSLVDQQVALANFSVSFTAGETIHTENSYKYDEDDLRGLADRAGWDVGRVWTSRDPDIGILLLTT